jgi:hypothetical protein
MSLEEWRHPDEGGMLIRRCRATWTGILGDRERERERGREKEIKKERNKEGEKEKGKKRRREINK